MPQPIEETLPIALRYDPATGKLFWRDDWYPHSTEKREVGYEDKGYMRLYHKGRLFMAHRVIWFLHYGEWPDGEIDHIDGDGLNNRIENLRLADRRTNSYNRPMYKCNKTGYKGVALGKKPGHYRAYIAKDGKGYWIGSYACPIEAARAYDRKAVELHGEYARTNFPIEDYLGA